MPGMVKQTSKVGGAARRSQRQGITRPPAPEGPSMRNGIHPDDRELFSLAGIDWSDVPDLTSTQQQVNGVLKAHSKNSNNNRVIAFEEDEPDYFLASITPPHDFRPTMPFLEAQRKKGSPKQIEAAEKAGCGPPIFVYGSSLFPEVLCQQLGVPVANAMHMAKNYIPAVAPYCTRYCLAGDVPLAAMVHNQDAQLNSYLKEPRKESHVRGALIFGLHQQAKQHLDRCYGAELKDDGGEGTWGPWKRVAVGVRCYLSGWNQPGWVIAETYIWNSSIARLHCFQQDLTWTPHLFFEFCQKERREAATKGVEYKGPPLWTSEDVREWEKRRPADIEEEKKRMVEEARKVHKKWGWHGTEGVKRQMREAEKRRLEASGVATGDMNNSQLEKAHQSPDAPTKTQNHHEDVEMKDAQEGSKQQALGGQKKHQKNGKQLNSSSTTR